MSSSFNFRRVGLGKGQRRDLYWRISPSMDFCLLTAVLFGLVAVAAFGLADAPRERLQHCSRKMGGVGEPCSVLAAVTLRDPAEVPPSRRAWSPEELGASPAHGTT